MSSNSLNLPDILPDIYRASNPLDAVKKHIETLEKEIKGDPKNLHAMLLKNALQQYYYCVSQLGNNHKKLFFALHENTVTKHTSLHHIKTIARTKSVLRFYNKCRRKIFEGNPVCDVTDIYACRIIIDDVSLSQEDLIQLCYQIADESILFMISQGYLPCNSSGVRDVHGNCNSTEFPNIIIPKDNELNTKNAVLIKDYIKHPKTDTAYQSLHIVFESPEGKKVELQIRTLQMDHHAEQYDMTKHAYYEETQDRKLPPLDIDRTEIHMSGYCYMYGMLTDDAGLEKSSPCMQETYNGLLW